MHGRVCWTYKSENQYIHHHALSVSLLTVSQILFGWSPNVHLSTWLHLSRPSLPPEWYLSMKSSTLGTLGYSPLLSSHPPGPYSSWSYFLLVWWERNLCSSKCFQELSVCSSLSLQIHTLDWALLTPGKKASGRTFKHRSSPRRWVTWSRWASGFRCTPLCGWLFPSTQARVSDRGLTAVLLS